MLLLSFLPNKNNITEIPEWDILLHFEGTIGKIIFVWFFPVHLEESFLFLMNHLFTIQTIPLDRRKLSLFRRPEVDVQNYKKKMQIFLHLFSSPLLIT